MINPDPLERLASCHERIETELQRLESLARSVTAHGADAGAQAEASALARYFGISAAQHHADEDGDFFPLLRRRAAALGRSEIGAALYELEREHSTLASQWQRLSHKLHDIEGARQAQLDADEVARFAWLYRRHMEREGALVLPFAMEVLTPEERAGLAKRMEERRAQPQ